MATEFRLNGKPVRAAADPDTPLLWVLREELALTGTKYGCGEGQCGACTVMLDDRAVRSCITPLRTAAGRQVTTIEGLERDGRLQPVQQAFLDAGAMQCGYCTPGMIVSAYALLRRDPHPTRDEIVRAMNGNICRCGTYGRIVAAIEAASKRS